MICDGIRELSSPAWQPIETAPKDGTRIDLWMVGSDGRSFREADAYYVRGAWEETVKFQEDGSFTRTRRQRDGWFAPNHDYDGADGLCDTPKFFNAHPRQRKWVWLLPTHWMPLPHPPVGSGSELADAHSKNPPEAEHG